MKKLLIGFVAALLLFTLYYYFRHPIGEKAIMNGHTIRLELALTESEKERGLSYRDSLPADTGMLFVYNHPDLYGFWMKGMRFPLDFIWINGNTVVEISRNIPNPQNEATQPVSLAPLIAADKVLELNAGIADKLGVSVGDLIQFID